MFDYFFFVTDYDLGFFYNELLFYLFYLSPTIFFSIFFYKLLFSLLCRSIVNEILMRLFRLAIFYTMVD